MFIPTHRIIANHIYENVSDRLDIKLNRIMLQYGNMKPDFTPSLKTIKHYKEPTFDFVLDEIVSLIDDGLQQNLISINNFSVRLGVITHFLSDFFCLPHHDRDYFSDKLKEHMIYEKNLHYKFKEFNGLEKLKIPGLTSLDKEGIRDFIEELHQEYINSPKGYENDIISSINVSSALGLLVIENSILYEPQLIAVY